MAQPEFDFETAIRTLTEGGVRFIVVGGVACAMNGAILATFDLDIVPARDPKNVKALLRVLDSLDAIYRMQPGRRFKPGSSHLTGPGHHNLITNCGPLDVLGAIGSGLSYHDLLPDTIEVEIDGGVRVRVLGLAKIIELKEQLGGAKDLAALPTLRQTLKEQQRGKV